MKGEELCSACGTQPARVSLDDIPLCDRCADRQLAAATGWPELPDPPPAAVFTGPDGRTHEMQFRLWRAPAGIVAEAQESNTPAGEGYHVDVMGGHDVDVDHLLRTLRERVAHEIGRLYLRPADGHQPGWTLTGGEVAGRLVHRDEDAPYAVVVDGRTLSWDDLGRALAAFEGWQFRLVIGDTDEQTGGDADVVSLPTADRHLLEVFADLEDAAEDTEWVLEQWEEAERDGVRLLRRALPDAVGAAPPEPALHRAAASIREGVRRDRWPYPHLAAAAGWVGDPPADDQMCCTEAAGALIGLHEDSGLDPEQTSVLLALEHADWLGAVIGLVRRGAGAAARPADLVACINACPEVDGQVDADDAVLLESAFDTVLYAWEAAGVVDADRTLTALGVWVLPRALAWAWNGVLEDLEDENPF